MSVELLIAGAGPCGVSAALWGRSLGLRCLVVDQEETAGGQLRHVHFRPANFAGSLEGEGPALAARLERQLAEAGIEIRRATRLKTLEPGGPAVVTREGERIEARAILIATGVRRRLLDAPGESAFEGRGVSYSATQDRASFAGEDVLVVGGGDAAFENALLLAEVGCRVTLAIRGAPRARAEFRARVEAEPRIEPLTGTRLMAIEGDGRVQSVTLEGPRGRYPLAVTGVVIKAGVIPNSEWCRGAVETDAEGYVKVNETLAASRDWIWAAGDVARPALAGLSVALGQGALAVAGVRGALRP